LSNIWGSRLERPSISRLLLPINLMWALMCDFTQLDGLQKGGELIGKGWVNQLLGSDTGFGLIIS
jgi:hypothetical protein